jgi:hypothetical protein
MYRTVYVIARRRTEPAVAKGRLEFLSPGPFPWTLQRGQALAFRQREHAEDFRASFPGDLAFAFVLWDQAPEPREGARP